jgi:hypothetical protein
MAGLLGPDLGDGQRRGTPTNSTSLQPLMGLLNGNSPKSWVAGHLLNAEFGGSGNAVENLTPLTSAANNAHKTFENHIKRMLLLCKGLDDQYPAASDWYGVRYRVDVSTDTYADPATINVGKMYSYAYSHIEVEYEFVTLRKFAPGMPPASPPPNTCNPVSTNALAPDPRLAALRNVILPTFAFLPAGNIVNWSPDANGIKFSVEVHNEP